MYMCDVHADIFTINSKHIVAHDYRWNFSRSCRRSEQISRIYLHYKQSHMARKILKF